MSFSSTSERSVERSNGARYCNYGQRAPLRTAWTEENLGRRFYGCSRYMEVDRCYYFDWIDPSPCPKCKQLLGRAMVKILKCQSEVDKYRKRIVELKTEFDVSRAMERHLEVEHKRLNSKRISWGSNNVMLGGATLLLLYLLHVAFVRFLY